MTLASLAREPTAFTRQTALAGEHRFLSRLIIVEGTRVDPRRKDARVDRAADENIFVKQNAKKTVE